MLHFDRCMPEYANKQTRQHTVQNQRVNVHNGSTMLRSDSRSAQLAGGIDRGKNVG
jgi:hypothetical protein